MRFRELLQIELWSKETSRKILIGLIVVAVVLIAWIAAERYWLTSAERAAGRAALAQIDKLQDFGTTGNDVFEARVKQARAQVDAAERAAWTTRDESVARTLGFYLDLTKIDQEDAQRQQLIRQSHSPLSFKDEEFANDMVASGERTRLELRYALHGALDQRESLF
jgi:hypothetical protein